MPKVREVSPEVLAQCVLSIAECRSLHALGRAYGRAVGVLTGSSAIGFYLLKGERPDLVYCRQVPAGFIHEHGTGLGLSDPLLDSICTGRHTVDGASLLGPYHWQRSTVYELLTKWGFSYNMCGPLCLENRVVGVVYTATRDAAMPYTDVARERMELLCRAGSMAMANMAREGRLDGPSAGEGASSPAWAPVSAEDFRDWLPPRAAEVAVRVCGGQSNKLIAREIGISDQTVKDHVGHLCRRFGAHNRTDLVARLVSGARIH